MNTTMTLPHQLPSVLLLTGLLAACSLDSSAKNECETQADCLDNLVCGPSQICEETEEWDSGPGPDGALPLLPTVLASGQDRPTGIATDGTSVYWATLGGDVMKVDKSGGTPATIASGQIAAREIAVDSTNVYWTGYGTGTWAVMKVPLSGGPPTMVASALSPTGLAVDATTIYWSDWGVGSETDGEIMKVPIAGGEITTLASGVRAPEGIAVDATNVYWPSGDFYSPIMKVAISGGAAAPVTPSQDVPLSVAVFESNIFWTSKGTTLDYHQLDKGYVMKAPLVGGTPIELATGQLRPRSIVTDGSYAYWTNQGDRDMESWDSVPNSGSVMRAAADGSELSSVAAGQNGPHSIAIDETHIYWTNEDDGTVLSLAKSDIL